jgi:hypothetical protein
MLRPGESVKVFSCSVRSSLRFFDDDVFEVDILETEPVCR